MIRARAHPRQRPKARLFGAAALIAGALTLTFVTAPYAGAATFPAAKGAQAVPATVKVSTTFDGGTRRFFGSGKLGSGDQSEGQRPLFELADGATLSNVILGSPAADGVHCLGSCKLVNVFWEDVGEDAATFKGKDGATYLVDGGGARKASDKVFQHNGGGTVTIRNFDVQDFGKLYRSCGNCKTQFKRSVVLDRVTVSAPGKSVVGINTNLGDTARLSNITVVGDSKKKISLCDRFTGNNTGAEPTKAGSGLDGKACTATGVTVK